MENKTTVSTSRARARYTSSPCSSRSRSFLDRRSRRVWDGWSGSRIGGRSCRGRRGGGFRCGCSEGVSRRSGMIICGGGWKERLEGRLVWRILGAGLERACEGEAWSVGWWINLGVLSDRADEQCERCNTFFTTAVGRVSIQSSHMRDHVLSDGRLDARNLLI